MLGKSALVGKMDDVRAASINGDNKVGKIRFSY